MHCVSGSETRGRVGSSIREGIAVAHPGNRPDPWRQCGSFHPSPTTPCPRRSALGHHTHDPPFSRNDHSQLRPGFSAYVARSSAIETLPPSDRAAMVTVSDGVGVLTTDDATRHGLAVRPIPESPHRRMPKLVPFAAAWNPIDVTGPFLNDPPLLDQAIELAATNGDYGSLVSFQGSSGRSPALLEATHASCIERESANPDKRFAVSEFCTEDYTRDLEAVGIPVYEDATPATCATPVLAGFARSFQDRRPRPVVPAPAAVPTGLVHELAAGGVPTVPARNAGPPGNRRKPWWTSASRSSSKCSRRTPSTRAISAAPPQDRRPRRRESLLRRDPHRLPQRRIRRVNRQLPRPAHGDRGSRDHPRRPARTRLWRDRLVRTRWNLCRGLRKRDPSRRPPLPPLPVRNRRLRLRPQRRPQPLPRPRRRPRHPSPHPMTTSASAAPTLAHGLRLRPPLVTGTPSSASRFQHRRPRRLSCRRQGPGHCPKLIAFSRFRRGWIRH